MSVQEFHIDPEFSIFRLVERKKKHGITSSHIPVLHEISREIENATLLDNADNILFCGFQYLSRFTNKIDRYTKIAQKCQHIYVFAVLDVDPPAIDNITFVPLLETDQLTKEWFIITYGEDFFSALAALEQTPYGTSFKDRTFNGTWIFDLTMVEILYEWLCRKVGLDPEHIEQTQQIIRNEVIMMEKTLERVNAFMEAETALNHAETIEETQRLVDNGLIPMLNDLRNA